MNESIPLICTLRPAFLASLRDEQQAKAASDRRTISVEGENAFRLGGKSATLAGRPDLVVLDERDDTIIDVKTGREQPWHRVQVVIYQYALSLALLQYQRRGHVPVPHCANSEGKLPKQCIRDPRPWSAAQASVQQP